MEAEIWPQPVSKFRYLPVDSYYRCGVSWPGCSLSRSWAALLARRKAQAQREVAGSYSLLGLPG